MISKPSSLLCTNIISYCIIVVIFNGLFLFLSCIAIYSYSLKLVVRIINSILLALAVHTRTSDMRVWIRPTALPFGTAAGLASDVRSVHSGIHVTCTIYIVMQF